MRPGRVKSGTTNQSLFVECEGLLSLATQICQTIQKHPSITIQKHQVYESKSDKSRQETQNQTLLYDSTTPRRQVGRRDTMTPDQVGSHGSAHVSVRLSAGPRGRGGGSWREGGGREDGEGLAGGRDGSSGVGGCTGLGRSIPAAQLQGRPATDACHRRSDPAAPGSLAPGSLSRGSRLPIPQHPVPGSQSRSTRLPIPRLPAPYPAPPGSLSRGSRLPIPQHPAPYPAAPWLPIPQHLAPWLPIPRHPAPYPTAPGSLSRGSRLLAPGSWLSAPIAIGEHKLVP